MSQENQEPEHLIFRKKTKNQRALDMSQENQEGEGSRVVARKIKKERAKN